MNSHTLASLILVTVFSYRFSFNNRKNKSLPPGPKPLPIIGNILDMPKENAWLKYTVWKKQYGGIIYLDMLGTSVVVLNSPKACHDLLDKRSSIYSDRPPVVMVSEVIGWDFNFVLFGYNSRWRRHRRLFHQLFNETTVATFGPIQEHCVHDLLLCLLNDPEKFLAHIRFCISKIIMRIVYDIKAKDDNNPHIVNAKQAGNEIFGSSRPGQFLVDFFPILKYIPSWMPGAEFKRKAREWNRVVEDNRNLPFNQVKEDIKHGAAGPSVVSSLLSQYDGSLDKVAEDDPTLKPETMEESIRDMASVAHAAGSETIRHLQPFFSQLAWLYSQSSLSWPSS